MHVINEGDFKLLTSNQIAISHAKSRLLKMKARLTKEGVLKVKVWVQQDERHEWADFDFEPKTCWVVVERWYILYFGKKKCESQHFKPKHFTNIAVYRESPTCFKTMCLWKDFTWCSSEMGRIYLLISQYHYVMYMYKSIKNLQLSKFNAEEWLIWSLILSFFWPLLSQLHKVIVNLTIK